MERGKAVRRKYEYLNVRIAPEVMTGLRRRARQIGVPLTYLVWDTAERSGFLARLRELADVTGGGGKYEE